MCDICNGRTHEELRIKMREYIGSRGWAVQAVGSSPQESGWVYTVGLIETFGHPELVVTHPDPAAYGSLLNRIGEHVRRGERFRTGQELDLGGYLVEFGSVHASYLADGLMASWDDCYRRTGASPGTLEVLQVVLPLTRWCEHCDRVRRCLAWPGGFDVGGDGPNRMARRAMMRRRDRRR